MQARDKHLHETQHALLAQISQNPYNQMKRLMKITPCTHPYNYFKLIESEMIKSIQKKRIMNKKK